MAPLRAACPGRLASRGLSGSCTSAASLSSKMSTSWIQAKGLETARPPAVAAGLPRTKEKKDAAQALPPSQADSDSLQREAEEVAGRD